MNYVATLRGRAVLQANDLHVLDNGNYYNDRIRFSLFLMLTLTAARRHFMSNIDLWLMTNE